MQLATVAVIALSSIVQPPPTPQPITYTLPLSGYLEYFTTPMTLTTPTGAPTSTPTFDFMAFVRLGGPVAAFVVNQSMNAKFITMYLSWRIGLIGIVFLFDFVMGKIGKRLHDVEASDSRLQQWRTRISSSKTASTIRSANETASYGRKLRRSR